MPQGSLFVEQDASPGRALAAGAALTAQLSADRPVGMYAATLQGDALVLGNYQRASQALSVDAQHGSVLRRRSGGATVLAGTGISYVALALNDRSALMACPPQRLLNRNVRGALQGLRLAGVAANYFGRDFLSFEARPAVYVGWDADRDDRVLLEFFVAEERTCWPAASALGYPPRKDDVLRGREPTTLAEAGARDRGVAALEKIAQGYATGFRTEWQSESPAALHASDSPSNYADELSALTWSLPLEEAIGFISAGVSLDGSGKFSAISLAGDFFAHRSCAETLSRMLLGVTPNSELVARAVDTAYAQPGHDFEGVRQLKNLHDAILDAAHAAKFASES